MSLEREIDRPASLLTTASARVNLTRMGYPAIQTANPKGASRAIPAPARRASARRSVNPRGVREKRHRYDRWASSGSYVGNDPVNATDPTGMVGIWGDGCADDVLCSSSGTSGWGSGQTDDGPGQSRHGPSGSLSNGGPPLDDAARSVLRILGFVRKVTIAGVIWESLQPSPANVGENELVAVMNGVRWPQNASQYEHILRGRDDHYADTPANRRHIEQVATLENFRGVNQGNVVLARINADGSETWVYVRGGEIQNAGRNPIPRWQRR